MIDVNAFINKLSERTGVSISLPSDTVPTPSPDTTDTLNSMMGKDTVSGVSKSRTYDRNYKQTPEYQSMVKLPSLHEQAVNASKGDTLLAVRKTANNSIIQN